VTTAADPMIASEFWIAVFTSCVPVVIAGYLLGGHARRTYNCQREFWLCSDSVADSEQVEGSGYTVVVSSVGIPPICE